MDFETYDGLTVEEKKAYMTENHNIDMKELKKTLKDYMQCVPRYDGFLFLAEFIFYRTGLSDKRMYHDWLEYKYDSSWSGEFIQKNNLSNAELKTMFLIDEVRAAFGMNNHMCTVKYLAKFAHVSVKTMQEVLDKMEHDGIINSVHFDSYRGERNVGYIRRSKKFFKGE